MSNILLFELHPLLAILIIAPAVAWAMWETIKCFTPEAPKVQPTPAALPKGLRIATSPIPERSLT